jgi:hypothetical protein
LTPPCSMRSSMHHLIDVVFSRFISHSGSQMFIWRHSHIKGGHVLHGIQRITSNSVLQWSTLHKWLLRVLINTAMNFRIYQRREIYWAARRLLDSQGLTEQAWVVITFLTWFREAPASILHGDMDCFEGIHGFPQSTEENSEVAPTLGQDRFLPNTFPNHSTTTECQ